MEIQIFARDLLVVLASGLVAGAICKRLGISLLVGYLVVGGLIGSGGLGWVTQQNHELEYLARAGALLLLFAVGIEFSIGELVRLSRYFSIGGAVQMVLVAVPLTATCLLFGMNLNAAILAGSAGALSSTILVFKALAESGQISSTSGRRGIGILLFQDVALVPLMLLVPLLTRIGDPPTIGAYLMLAGKSLLFISAVVLVQRIISRWGVSLLAKLRSVEIVVLFALSLLGGMCWGAHVLGLPAALGALAAGIVLSGNRLSKQVDSIVLPFRESFAAIFFVTLGTLLHPGTFLDEPLLLTAGLIGMLTLKAGAASIALKLTGLKWKSALGMGLGLAQLGEFSFLLIAEGFSQEIFGFANYNRMLFIAIGTLILTPLLLRIGLRWSGDAEEVVVDRADDSNGTGLSNRALIIGMGPIGRQVALCLENRGKEVYLIDFSPVNLHPLAQQGFTAVAGDARNVTVLKHASAESCPLGIVTVPDDEIALQIVTALRQVNSSMHILARCRYQENINRLKKAGANVAVSEEVQVLDAILQQCNGLIPMPFEGQPAD